MLSKKLRQALEADKEYNGDEYEDPKDFYPNLMKVIDTIEQRENNSFIRIHDFWGLQRPFGLHAILGEDDGNTREDLQTEQ